MSELVTIGITSSWTMPLDLIMVLLSHLTKKNLRFHWVSIKQQGKQCTVNEVSIAYDPTPDQNYLKLYLKQEEYGFFTVGILCNQLEFEMLYKRYYPTVLMVPDITVEEEFKQSEYDN